MSAPPAAASPPVRDAPRFARRFATAMWDFSWLTRRTGAEAEYADPAAVLDGLAERGYDNVRIDAFPHLVASDENGGVRRRFLVPPQRPRFMWGNHAAVEIEPATALVVFVAAARERGISIGLSSWFVQDAHGRRDGLRTPVDLALAWSAVLALLEDAQLLDAVAWVDLCNEFPLDLWAPGPARAIFGHAFGSPAAMALRGLPWSAAVRARVARYWHEAIAPLRRRWPGLRYTFSCQGLGGDSLRAIEPVPFDLAEVHAWLTDDLPWAASTLQLSALLEWPGGVRLHSARVGDPGEATLRAWRDDVLRPRLLAWRSWAEDRGLPLVTTEGWGPTNYADVRPDGSEWRWVKRFSALAVEEAVRLGWTGVCTSNFAQPHHQGMWRDVGWHREMTRAIRAEPAAPVTDPGRGRASAERSADR